MGKPNGEFTAAAVQTAERELVIYTPKDPGTDQEFLQMNPAPEPVMTWITAALLGLGAFTLRRRKA
jgi:MYXO-CTERM domain-containing protein